MELTRELTITDFEGGAIIERIETELQEVVADCLDVNKVPDSVREITCKIKIKPDAQRITMAVGIETSSKLGTRHPIISKAFLDPHSGKALEMTVKEGNMFDEEGQPAISVIGGTTEPKQIGGNNNG